MAGSRGHVVGQWESTGSGSGWVRRVTKAGKTGDWPIVAEYREDGRWSAPPPWDAPTSAREAWASGAFNYALTGGLARRCADLALVKAGFKFKEEDSDDGPA